MKNKSVRDSVVLAFVVVLAKLAEAKPRVIADHVAEMYLSEKIK